MLPPVIKGEAKMQGRLGVVFAGLAAAIACAQAGVGAPRATVAPSSGRQARSELVWTKAVAPEVTRYRYRYGPLLAAPGHNLILVGPAPIEKPAGDGYMTRVRPDLVDASGKAPPIEQVHMHHAVSRNLSRKDTTYPSRPQRISGVGQGEADG